MARKPRFTQYEMNRYVKIQDLAVTADSATGRDKVSGHTYVPYTPEEIEEILRLRKEAGKPLLTYAQREKIGQSLGLFIPNEALLKTNDIAVATDLWIDFYNKNIGEPDKFGNYLFSDRFAPKAEVAIAQSEGPDFCARIVACCDPRVQ